MTFAFTAAEKARFSVRRLCAALDASPSGCYAWQQRGPAARTLQDRAPTRQLRLVHADSRGTYGRPRLQRALARRGYRLSEKRVTRLMRAAGLVIAALDRALTTRACPRGLLHHSDRGVQYTSAAYVARLAAVGIRVSMSRVGNCWDNAPVESFFSSLKAEAMPHVPWPTRHAARLAIADHLRFYNERRLHSSLGFQSPQEYEAKLAAGV